MIFLRSQINIILLRNIINNQKKTRIRKLDAHAGRLKDLRFPAALVHHALPSWTRVASSLLATVCK